MKLSYDDLLDELEPLAFCLDLIRLIAEYAVKRRRLIKIKEIPRITSLADLDQADWYDSNNDMDWYSIDMSEYSISPKFFRSATKDTLSELLTFLKNQKHRYQGSTNYYDKCVHSLLCEIIQKGGQREQMFGPLHARSLSVLQTVVRLCQEGSSRPDCLSFQFSGQVKFKAPHYPSVWYLVHSKRFQLERSKLGTNY